MMSWARISDQIPLPGVEVHWRVHFVSVVLRKERQSSFVVLARIRILRRIVDKHWQKWLSHRSESWKIHPTIEQPLIVPVSRIIIAILTVSQH